MGRPISQERLRIREALRVIESERLHALDAEDLAARASVNTEVVARCVRKELNAGLYHMGDILLTMNDEGREASDIWTLAVKANPYPMWWNCSRMFQEPVYLHLTYRRFQKLLGRFGLKQMRERDNKLSLVEGMSRSCPALADALKDSRKALKGIAELPSQSEVQL